MLISCNETVTSWHRGGGCAVVASWILACRKIFFKNFLEKFEIWNLGWKYSIFVEFAGKIWSFEHRYLFCRIFAAVCCKIATLLALLSYDLLQWNFLNACCVCLVFAGDSWYTSYTMSTIQPGRFWLRKSKRWKPKSLCINRMAEVCSQLDHNITHCNRTSMPVFFNFFVAAEPYTSVKVIHRTPCIDPWLQRCMQGWSYISLASHWGQSHHEEDKADKDHQYKIWLH